MKTIVFSLIAICSHQVLLSQCQILGSGITQVNDHVTYSSEIAAKCTDCYQWSIEPSDLIMIESNKEGQIKTLMQKEGVATLKLTLESEGKTISCEKKIEINPRPITKEKNCNIEINDFKDVKVDNKTVAFFPNIDTSKYRYQWTVTYSDGSHKSSSEKIPQFSNNESLNIDSTTLQISNLEALCTTIITRTYGHHYWYPKVEKVKQRVYTQGSYKDPKK